MDFLQLAGLPDILALELRTIQKTSNQLNKSTCSLVFEPGRIVRLYAKKNPNSNTNDYT